MYFDELNLNNNVLDALYDMRFEKCTPVQEKCIPEILNGNDILGVAQTGTGKTAAYLLPILSKLDDGGYPERAINCLIMSPTRELAQQIDQAMQGFGYYLNGVSSVAVYGGNDGNRYDQELKSLQLGADVVIATPGRLISHISLGNVDLSKVSFFILDEADRMLDMGFSDDILKIAKKLPKNCQTIMFSATMPKKIEELAKTLLKQPKVIKLAVSKPAEKIHQSAYVCHEGQKIGIINQLFKNNDLQRVIIFCGSKMKVKQVAGALQRKHINCGEMHSDLDQATRDDVMFKFKSGQFDVLVATDVISRGIDIDDITMVINYDVPHDAEDYVHRIGRTARAARTGTAITFVSEDDAHYFQQIEKFLGNEVEKLPLPEALGQAPEYNTDERPRKNNSAKNRRRNDRNQTAHRDSKQHEHGRRNNRNTRGNNGKGEAQSAANTEKRQGNRQQQRQQGQNNNRTNETTDSAQRNTRTPNNNHKNRRQNNRQGNTEGRGQEQERNNNTERRNNYNRRNNNRRPQRQGEDRQRRNSSSPKAAATTTPVTNHESGIAKLIKRPLRWLKALGKK